MIPSENFRSRHARRLVLLAIGFLFVSVFANANADGLPLVEIKAFAPSIIVDLRYATPKNVTGRALYPPGMRAFVLPSVAQQLASAQKFLRKYDYGIKIWDAYRPKEAQELLFKLAGKGDYVSNPESGFGSMHTWGVSVDATLVDVWGREMTMPTGFDEFTPAAMMYYKGGDPQTRAHLHLLQVAMAANNFYGLRIEWWHFTTADWKKYVPEADKNKIESNNLKATAPAPLNSKS
jgi:D-alanyl-D-alanine dipeptidase